MNLPLAFGFSNLAMLGWLGAAAAPILIHLWMRHTHRDTPWAAMEFLRQAIERNSRRLKLQQWLLLAVRTLLLVLLALAAAKPFFSDWSLLGGGQVHRVIVLDATMSMQYETGDQSSFERAQKIAAELLSSGRPGDVYSLCVISESASVVTGPSTDARRIAAEVSSIRPSYASGQVADVLPAVRELIDKAETNHRSLAGHQVLVLSDAARHGWQSTTSGGADADTLSAIAERASVTLVDVGPTATGGVAVNNLRVASGLSTTAEPTRLVAEVTNHSDSPVTDLSVQLTLNGQSVDQQTLTIPSRTTLPVEFDIRFRDTGWQDVSIRTSGDALAADDVAWLALDVRPSVRVLLVEGTPRAGRYVDLALNPSGSQSSPIEVLVAAEDALVDQPLDEFACVFLCNVAQFTPVEQKLIERYVRQGGSLVVVMGDRVMPGSYNSQAVAMQFWRLLLQGSFPTLSLVAQVEAPEASPIESWFPAQLGPLKSNDQPGIDPLDYQHPIAAAFRGKERAGLLSMPVTRYYELTPASSAEVALALPGGDPFLVTGKHGQGCVAVLATGTTLDDSERTRAIIPSWPSFLPIIQETLAFGLATTRADNQAIIGETIDGPLPTNFSPATIDVLRPDEQMASVPVKRFESETSWQYEATDLPGIYAAGASSTTSAEKSLGQVAVNVPVSESDLSRIDTTDLPDGVAIQSAPPDASQFADSLAAEASVHRLMLYGALLLLLVEPVLAWWFAGRSI